METFLSPSEQLPSLLAASRSGLVGSWDPATLERALRWGRFFQQLHSRLHAQPGLRATLKRRLCQGGKPALGLGHLRGCPELLGLALLENRALPPAARQRLLRGLLCSPAGGEEEPFAPVLARRKAASQLLRLALLPEASSAEPREAPPLRAQAQLLLSRLREEGGGDHGQRGCGDLLEHLPGGPMLYRAVAAALLEPSGDAQQARAALLSWLVEGDPARQAAFFRLLPVPWLPSLCRRHPELRDPYLSLLSVWGSRLSYDPLQGEWKAASGLEEEGGQVCWRELRERVGCLYREPEPLGSAVRSQLKRLKAQDGDFEVRGLSVWTDLLLDLETLPTSENKPKRGCLV
ncbi:Fanconi anemia group F protein [Hemicordylus capensis]|uniref:Fanconi anemia group F protein n=1 Tax=Hemicordylus capensis TaxID=884348 RepID=UPI002304BFFE|nr:Fanconi anemia group F protein [Hemicordylus capensis]